MGAIKRDDQIEALAAQFQAAGMEKTRAVDYATRQVDGKDYQKFVSDCRGVFVGEVQNDL